MSILESIMGNKTLVNAALGQLKNIIKKEGFEFIVIKVDPDTDEIVLNMYQPGEAVLTVNTINTAEIIEVPALPEPEKPNEDADHTHSPA